MFFVCYHSLGFKCSILLIQSHFSHLKESQRDNLPQNLNFLIFLYNEQLLEFLLLGFLAF